MVNHLSIDNYLFSDVKTNWRPVIRISNRCFLRHIGVCSALQSQELNLKRCCLWCERKKEKHLRHLTKTCGLKTNKLSHWGVMNLKAEHVLHPSDCSTAVLYWELVSVLMKGTAAELNEVCYNLKHFTNREVKDIIHLLSLSLFWCLWALLCHPSAPLFFPLSAPEFAVWSRSVSRWPTCFRGCGGCSLCFQSTAVCSFLPATTGRTSRSSSTRTQTSSRPSRNTNRKACTPRPPCEVGTIRTLSVGEEPCKRGY